MGGKIIDLSGERFGRLTVLSKVSPHGQAKYFCHCECGNETVVRASDLIRKATTSCGCLRREKCIDRSTTHGMKGSKVYNIWRSMIERCENRKDKRFEDYGGRGIKVCDKWHKFGNWYAYMGQPPSSKHSLDRINNNGNYEPGNCRWATQKEQAANRRANVFLEFNGQVKTLTQWAEELGIGFATLWSRINESRWTVERALTTPVRGRP